MSNVIPFMHVFFISLRGKPQIPLLVVRPLRPYPSPSSLVVIGPFFCIYTQKRRNILTENILNRSEKSSNHSRIQFKTMIISGEIFGKIWYDPRCLVRYPSHKIPLSTDTREMVKAEKMWRKVMLPASGEGDTNHPTANKGRETTIIQT